MSVAIIRERESADVLSEIITDVVCTTINSTKTVYKMFDIDDVDLKVCTKDCMNRDSDRYSKFGCKKSSTCIDEHNKAVTEAVLNELSLHDEFIFIVGCHSRLSLFLEELRRMEYEKNKKDDDNKTQSSRHKGRKNCLVIISSGKKRCSIGLSRDITNLSDKLVRFANVNVIDSFIFDHDSGNYMMEMIPFAVRTFIDHREKISKLFTEHYGQIELSDISNLPPDVFHRLNLANVHTVGELSLMKGEQIFIILDQRYDLVGNLIFAYLKNDIPIELLNDLVQLSEDHRRKKLKEIESELKRQEDTLNEIGKRLENVKKAMESQTNGSRLLE